MSFAVACNTFGGRSTDEFARIGSSYEVFKDLETAYTKVLLTEMPYRQHEGETESPQKQAFVTALENLRTVLKKYYQSIDRSKFSKKDLSQLDKDPDMMRLLDDRPFNDKDNWMSPGQPYRFVVYEFYRTVFPSLKYNIKDRGARLLSEAVDCLKQHQLSKARELLEKIYHSVGTLTELSPRQVKDYEHVLIESLYLEYSEKIEEIELRAGLASIFTKLRKLERESHSNKNILERSWFLEDNIKEYKQFRFDREFPNSPWKQAILDFDSSSWPEKDFQPKPGPRLEKLLQNPSP